MPIVFDDEQPQRKSKIVFDDEVKPSISQRFMPMAKESISSIPLNPINVAKGLPQIPQYLPTAGAVAGGMLGSVGGIPGAIGGSALGAGAGEAVRQLINRVTGQPSPQTSMEAAKNIGIQGGLGAASEVLGQGAGKLGGMMFKGFPRLGQMVSGTPARNLAKAQQRGLFETYAPSVAKGLSRESAGEAKGLIEDQLLGKYFKPEEIAKLKLRKSGYADQTVEDALVKQIKGEVQTVPEALKTVKAVDIIYKDTPSGSKVAPELAQLRKTADKIVSEAHPEYKLSKQKSEATILKSQLSMPFRVNKTRPDEFSGALGTLGMLKPLAFLLSSAGSPLATGLAAGTMGSVKNAVSPLMRKAIQRTIIQRLLQAGASPSLQSSQQAVPQ